MNCNVLVIIGHKLNLAKTNVVSVPHCFYSLQGYIDLEETASTVLGGVVAPTGQVFSSWKVDWPSWSYVYIRLGRLALIGLSFHVSASACSFSDQAGEVSACSSIWFSSCSCSSSVFTSGMSSSSALSPGVSLWGQDCCASALRGSLASFAAAQTWYSSSSELSLSVR